MTTSLLRTAVTNRRGPVRRWDAGRIARVTFLPFSFEVYSSKMPIIWRISSWEGSSPVGCVIETTSTPSLRRLRIVSSISAPLR